MCFALHGWSSVNFNSFTEQSHEFIVNYRFGDARTVSGHVHGDYVLFRSPVGVWLKTQLVVSQKDHSFYTDIRAW